MNIDLSKLSLSELNEVISQATQLRAKLVDSRRAELMEELRQLDLIKNVTQSNDAPLQQRTRKSRSKTRKYADSNGNYWGGTGPRPGWLKKLLESGVNLDDLKVRGLPENP